MQRAGAAGATGTGSGHPCTDGCCARLEPGWTCPSRGWAGGRLVALPPEQPRWDTAPAPLQPERGTARGGGSCLRVSPSCPILGGQEGFCSLPEVVFLLQSPLLKQDQSEMQQGREQSPARVPVPILPQAGGDLVIMQKELGLSPGAGLRALTGLGGEAAVTNSW